MKFKQTHTTLWVRGHSTHDVYFSLFISSSGCSHREKPELIALHTMVYFNAFETNSFFKFRRICKIKTQLSKI